MTNINRVVLEPAFVIHSRPYRNSSLIVELFTRRYGRIVVVARSARGPRSRYQGNLQLFLPLLVSWSGRSELKSLGNIEICSTGFELNGDALFCGFYLNELLLRLLKHEDPYPEIYERYQELLNCLEKNLHFEAHLRYFEKHILKDLGYGLLLNRDVETGEYIKSDAHYLYVPQRGFVRTEPRAEATIFRGDVLQALDSEHLITQDQLKQSKRLMRLILSQYLGRRPIHTRALL